MLIPAVRGKVSVRGNVYWVCILTAKRDPQLHLWEMFLLFWAQANHWSWRKKCCMLEDFEKGKEPKESIRCIPMMGETWKKFL